LAEAVWRLIDDAEAEESDLRHAAQTGIADIEAGRFTLIASAEDAQELHKQLMVPLRDLLPTQENRAAST
jgi:hypothetical protein